ncbi:MAG: primosomal protein N', partial [Pseudomonadota bacterium]|nr:primosomal protein N' [Pseudomonadota bacterium]
MSQSTLFAEDKTPQASTARLKKVLVPYPVDKAYSYGVPTDIEVEDGDYVTVPLGNREVPGVVWGDSDEDVPPKKLKDVIARYDLPPMSLAHRKFIDWTAHYNMAPKGFVMKMALSAPGALEPPKPVTGYCLPTWVMNLMAEEGTEKDKFLKNLSPQRRKVLDALQDGMPKRAAEIADMAGCTPSVVKGMADKELLEVTHIYSAAPCRAPQWEKQGVQLSEAQEAAADTMKEFVRDGQFHAALLDGVTGAGKTEVYFEAIAEALKNNKQVLLLLPEIALSNAFLERFKKRFGCAPALWHSHLATGQRKTTWRGVAEGETKVVVGARSALYLPYQDLGLIIIDEEHDPAYKQEDGVIYHARDMAIVRAHIGKFPILLVSATPSLETISNCWSGRYAHLHLPDRHGGARLPDMHIVDMKADKPDRQHFIAPPLVEA